MKEGCKAVAQRICNAETGFVELIQEMAGCTKAEAQKVLQVYCKFRMVKLDALGGVYRVKHGAYLDKDVIQNAINHK